jgi:pyruvate/2-oxoglutarate dehydrogenase complex dihydrolipoamide dehydrogenase (E3) component
LWKYWLASQVGMLPATLVYVNAGTQLGKLDNLSEILRPGFVIALVLLGLLPFLARGAMALWTRRKLYARWTRPAKFDRNLIVIGAGSAGLVGTYIARALKAEVTLIEAGKMGGDCLNTGCVPSKALIHFGKLAHEAQKAKTLGFQVTGQANLKTVMAGLREAIATIEPHDSVERYQDLGAEVLTGHATLIDPWTVDIATPEGTTRRTARAILLATGAAPAVPDIPGLKDAVHVTSDTLWDHLDTLDALPQRIAVLGGGPIGCELAQAFARLGARVTLIHRGARLLKADEPEAATIVETALRRDGVDVRLNDTFSAVEGKTLRLASGDMQADLIVVATGRGARLDRYGLETLGIKTDRLIEVNDRLQTSLPNIYAAGDCASPQQFTHLAAHQATTATINALLNGLWSLKLKSNVVPRVTFTDPEVAAVGLTREQAPDAEVTDFPLARLDRAVAEGVREGFVRVLTEKGRDRILGATIVGPRAGEMIGEFALAMQSGLGLKAILRTVHAYPTWSDAVKLTAGAYTRERVSPRTSHLLARFNAWRRG